jgi:ribokinase
MRAAAVGHVEWVEFVRVPKVPVQGEIARATGLWDDAAGGAAVAAVQLAKLSGAAVLITALGDDDLGHRVPAALAERQVRVEAVWRDAPQRRAVTFLDDDGERTITVIGERHQPNGADDLPWNDLHSTDAVYFTAGDAGALRRAREAAALVATARVLPVLSSAGVRLDAVVGSGNDPSERYEPFEPTPRLVVLTDGARGGSYSMDGGEWRRYEAAPLPGALVDLYGCGDSFAAGLTHGLGAGLPAEKAIELAARCGAACATGRGPYEGQLRHGPSVPTPVSTDPRDLAP